MPTYLLGALRPEPDLRQRANAQPPPAALYYLLASPTKLAATVQKQLAALLGAKPAKTIAAGQLVVGKSGLRSAWARNVEQIIAACGIVKNGKITIERGRLYANKEKPAHDLLLEDVLVNSSTRTWHEHSKLRKNTQVHAGATLASNPALAKHVQEVFAQLKRKPTPEEIAFLAQLNCDHCSHATFKASWPDEQDQTPLLARLQATYAANPTGVQVAYRDNAAVITASSKRSAKQHLVLKAETHNHPTALSPFEGAATGVGGEIRDETATGCGGMPLAGFAGYIVSSLEAAPKHQSCVSSARDIAIDAPLGASAYANEFGRPQVAGFLRSYAGINGKNYDYGFAKPVMLAGGVGLINDRNVTKRSLTPGDKIVILGGAGSRVGLAGASASSSNLDATSATDQASGSVQRGYAEMQRRAQEVINACANTKHNPLIRLHDVGAGGVGNAVVEMLAFTNAKDTKQATLGCEITLEKIPADQKDMSATEILINEAQERYVAVVAPSDLSRLTKLAKLEGCPLAAIGKVGGNANVIARHNGKIVVKLPLAKMFAPAGVLESKTAPIEPQREYVNLRNLTLETVWPKVLAHPAVADKSFLTTIADRNVGGLVVRDQHVGPWQVVAADCAVVRLGHFTTQACAFALGERAPLATIDPAAAARIAITEALTNLASAPVGALEKQKLVLNWMANAADAKDRSMLFRAVDGVCGSFLKDLKLAVVGGKDSVAMHTKIKKQGQIHSEVAPAMCVASAFGQLADVDAIKTPQLSFEADTVLMYLPVNARRSLAASVLAQCFDLAGNDVPDVTATELKAWWRTIMALHKSKLLLAYHDISDGGMLATVVEMALCANRGITLVLDALCPGADSGDADGFENSSNSLAAGGMADVVAALCCETPGAVIEVRRDDAAEILTLAGRAKAGVLPQTIGRPNAERKLRVYRNAQVILERNLDELHASWSELGNQLRSERDANAQRLSVPRQPFGEDPGLYATAHVIPKLIRPQSKPAAVVVRSFGSNGHVEMAAALDLAGFAARIISLSQLASGEHKIAGDRLLVLPGGFSHGDALGAGTGQAQTILHSSKLRKTFADFFAAPDTLTLGVCNGCQVLAQLQELLADACELPRFAANLSRRFESRLVMVEVLASPSPFLAPLAGIRLPVPVACGEGRTLAPRLGAKVRAVPALRYLGPDDLPATSYPYDPCGSDDATCSYVSADGKLTLLMPHPERAVLASQLSWCPPAWQKRGQTPWHDFFVNARNHLLTN